MVFGLALSLGALLLVNLPLGTPNELYFGLAMFGFSFLILVTVWYRYASIMGTLPMETRGIVVLNLVLLFVVAIEPYLLYVLALHATSAVGEPASVLYALDLAAMNTILGGFMHVLSREEKRLVSPASRRKMRVNRNFAFASGIVFLVTALPVFWTWIWIPGVPSRVLIWLLTLPAAWIVRLLNR